MLLFAFNVALALLLGSFIEVKSTISFSWEYFA